MKQQQIEIGFDRSANFQPPITLRRRRQRARWWFSQMRQVVDRAFDWAQTVTPPPEQIPLSLGLRR